MEGGRRGWCGASGAVATAEVLAGQYLKPKDKPLHGHLLLVHNQEYECVQSTLIWVAESQ